MLLISYAYEWKIEKKNYKLTFGRYNILQIYTLFINNYHKSIIQYYYSRLIIQIYL